MILKWWNKPAKQTNQSWMMRRLKSSLERAKKKWQLNTQTRHHKFYFLCRSSFSTSYTGFILALLAENCLWLRVPVCYIFSGLVHNLWHLISAKSYEFYFLCYSSFSTLHTGFISQLLARNCFQLHVPERETYILRWQGQNVAQSSLNLVREYTQIFVPGHYLFL